jgi:NodT family efflux transporter outer membrane factor (OMF) lipoprotein
MTRVERFEACIIAMALLVVAGCSFAPPRRTPDVPVAAEYKEIGPWASAEPADHLPRDAWWKLYGDAQLDELEQRLLAHNPDLAAALASYNEARAYSDQLRAGLFPTISAQGSFDRDRQSDTAPLRGNGPANYNSDSLGLATVYELDLWGRIRNQIASGRALAAASEADLESARLSLTAQLADDWVVLRGLDRDSALLEDTVQAYRRALDLTIQRHDGGIAPGLDVARAQTQLEVARSQAAQTLAQRALIEHAIAALVGDSPSTFAIAPDIGAISLPTVPTGVPSTLLQRRPDVAAAERRMAAANADIGVARAAYFPSISLDAEGGVASAHASQLLRVPSRVWAVGPSLDLPLFDAGRRRAQVAQARAVLEETSSQYRSVALAAFQQVEDELALLDHYQTAAQSERAAVEAAQRSLVYSMDRYRNGAVNYLDVVTSQTAALQTQRDEINLETLQLRASVSLIRALGGGWSGQDPRT